MHVCLFVVLYTFSSLFVWMKMTDRRHLNTYARQRNYSYIEEQNDQRTEQLHSKVKLLKYIAIQIREETKHQNVEITVWIEKYILMKLLLFFFTFYLEISKIDGSNE
jgi:hypothetical protein